jgi:hypothetical protein
VADIVFQGMSEVPSPRQRSAGDVRGPWWQTEVGSGCQRSLMADRRRQGMADRRWQGMSEVPDGRQTSAGDVRGL